MNSSNLNYPQIVFGDKILGRKQCVQCSSTFWHVDPAMKYCGSEECNLNFNRCTLPKSNTSLKDTLSQFVNFFKSNPISAHNKVHAMRRAKTASKYSSTNMFFICAGCSAFESMLNENYPERVNTFSRDLFINTQFCYRFLDKKNVGVTGRHSTGFFMSGLHCFESVQDKFPLDWQDQWATHLIRYFSEELKINLNQIYIHADYWSDSIRGGPSIEFFVNGIEVGNMVFTIKRTDLQQELKNRYLDVGLGIERIHNIVSENSLDYFKTPLRDHLRSLLIGFADMLYPSKIGLGYNLRKLVETILRDHTRDLAQLRGHIEQITQELRIVLEEDTFNEKLVQIAINIMSQELKRCIQSNII